MLLRMAKVNSVIRCITSRQICFPLIFTIATISLVTTLAQFSHITVPNVNQMLSLGEDRVLQRSQRVVDLWHEWKPQEEDAQPKKMLKTPGIEMMKSGDAIQKIRLPFANNNFKPKKKIPKLRPSSERRNTTKTNTASTSMTSRKQKSADTFRQDAQTSRQRIENHINDSDTDNVNVDRYLKARGTADDPFRLADTPRTDNFTLKAMLGSLPEQTKGVIIVTNYRSGSTFLGELFNQHPQAFYTFEPLYPFGTNCSFQVPRRIETLRNMLTCSFPSMQTLYRQLGANPRANNVHASCMRNNFCFRYNHKHLCTRDMCPRGYPKSCVKCGPVNLSLVDKKCRSRKVSAIKVIKLCYIESLEPLFQDPSLDLKIVHLVRDPRGIASSRLKIHPDWDIADNIITTCQRQIANVKTGKSHEWLKDRYKLIRYEDIATNPMELAKEIYDFVGLQFSRTVQDWIVQNTQSKGSKASNTRAKLLGMKKNDGYSAEKDPYSTQRDSSTAMQAWRSHISFDTTEKIQRRCFEMMRTLGYKDFRTEGDLLNLNISAVLSL